MTHLLTIATHGQTIDESVSDNEEQNEIEWKSIRRKFIIQRCSPESFRLIALELEILQPGSGEVCNLLLWLISLLLQHTDRQ